jgi:hypothetical protein
MTSVTARLALRHIGVTALIGCGLAACATGSDESYDAGGGGIILFDSGRDAQMSIDTGMVMLAGDSGDAGSPRADAGKPDAGGSDAKPSGEAGSKDTGGGGTDTGMETDSGHDAGHDAGHDSGHDAGHDAGNCKAVTVPSGNGGAGACPSPTSSSCAPGGLSGFTASAPAPLPMPGACSSTQPQKLYNDCLGTNATMAKCNADATNDATCYNCIFGSLVTDAAWGPIVSASNGLVHINAGGCLSILEPCNAACATANEEDLQCEVTACSANCPVSTQADLDNYDTCIETADTCDPGGCATYYTASQCSTSITGAAHPGSVCFSGATFEANFLNIVPVFCVN